MNFDGRTQEELMLEQVWGTKHGWASQLNQSDLCKLDGFKDIPVFMSLHEFVFTAQILLAHFASASHNWVSSIKRGGIQSMRGGLIRGENYNLLKGNCQHFSMFLLDYLRGTGPEAGFTKASFFKLRMLEPLIYSMLRVQDWKLYRRIDQDDLETFAEGMRSIQSDYERRNQLTENVDDFLNTLFAYKRGAHQPTQEKFIHDLANQVSQTYGHDPQTYGSDVAKLVSEVIVNLVFFGREGQALAEKSGPGQPLHPTSREATMINENAFMVKLGLGWPGRDPG